MRDRCRLATALTVAAVVLSSCRSAPPRPNIILITVDTLRADRLSVYGDAGIQTPNIGRLAAEGIVFENAFTNVTWTVPSLTTVMTGEYPFEHGMRTWDDQLDDTATLAKVLRQGGYHTAAIVASAALDRVFGLDQGFDYYDDSLKPQGELRIGASGSPAEHALTRPGAPWRPGSYLADDKLADKAIAWLDRQPKQPFFLWVHFFGPHEKPERDGSVSVAGARVIGAYDPDVEFMDRQVGRLLSRIRTDPAAARTAILFQSDHGQSLKEHGIIGHGLDLYDTTEHVPLIIRLPGKRYEGKRVARVVANIDLFPTVLHLAGVPRPRGTHGHDLLAAGGKDEAVYMETFLSAADLFGRDVQWAGKKLRVAYVFKGLRTRRWKLVVRTPKAPTGAGDDVVRPLPAGFVAARRIVQLFDLSNDPAERKNVAAAFPRTKAEMLAQLGDYGSARPAGSHVGLDSATRERLRALGYLKQ